jgi:hypothetical protein
MPGIFRQSRRRHSHGFAGTAANLSSAAHLTHGGVVFLLLCVLPHYASNREIKAGNRRGIFIDYFHVLLPTGIPHIIFFTFKYNCEEFIFAIGFSCFLCLG